jgi:pyruvate kinase
MDSMVSSNQPTRQELTEVSIATTIGADGFILTKETSIGKFFCEATISLAKAIAEAESVVDYEQFFVDAS